MIATSGSGNSPTILRAVEWANAHDLSTFGCTGYSGGKLKQIAQHSLHVPLDDMGIVESIHLTAFHWVVGATESRCGAGRKEKGGPPHICICGCHPFRRPPPFRPPLPCRSDRPDQGQPKQSSNVSS